MVKIVPVDRERYASKAWRHPVGYGFATRISVLPLGASEFRHAVPAMPIGFVARSGRYIPAALVAVMKARNVFVGPTGQWLGGYVPATLRAYPFSLRRVEGSEPTLCIDEDSGLVADASEEQVEKFFEADGTRSAMT